MRGDFHDVILLLHGVKSAGQWFGKAQAALRPWFTIEPARYPGYTTPGLGFAFTLEDQHGIARRVTGKGNDERLEAADRTLAEAYRAVVEQVRPRQAGPSGDWLPADVVPHAIAHSWGSYLWHRSTTHGYAWDIVVLAGSPLRSELPVARATTSGGHLHNIVQAQDRLLEGLSSAFRDSQRLESLVPTDIGRHRFAGRDGLDGSGLPPRDTHSVVLGRQKALLRYPWPPCEHCGATQGGRLHNWTVQGDHSKAVSTYEGVAHVLRPLLWRLDPGDLSRFYASCRAVSRTGGNPIARSALLEKAYRWLGGGSVREYLGRSLSTHPLMIASPDDYLTLLGMKLAQRFTEAEARDREAFANAPTGQVTTVDVSGDRDIRYRMHPMRLLEEQVRRELASVHHG